MRVTLAHLTCLIVVTTGFCFAEDHTQTKRPTPEYSTTWTGYRFYKAKNIKLGLTGWKDHRGRLWLDAVLNEDGTSRLMTYEEAIKHCEAIGAKLPDHVDFDELRQYMGHSGGTYANSYVPQILPNLEHSFWTSAIARPRARDIFWFNGRTGRIGYIPVENTKLAVRCVVK